MPKAEKGTPKDVANKSKAKGLQKLRWYCQMCNKQCRDENGMKCHMTSESHLRQMKMFSENASNIMDQFSTDFEKSYMETLRRRHGTTRMNANNIYQEVIQDKDHVHMNSTIWATLTDFVQYLGKKGLCVVEETERGWYVQYVERDPFLLQRKEAAQRRADAERREEIKAAKRMEKQRAEAAAALDRAGGTVSVEASKLDRSVVGGGTISVSLTGLKKKPLLRIDKDSNRDGKNSTTGKDYNGEHNKQSKKRERVEDKNLRNEVGIKSKKPMSSLNQIMAENEARRADAKRREETERKSSKSDIVKEKRKDYWIREGIIVKIISKKLNKGAYYKCKCVIEEVIDKYTAKVEILDSDADARDGSDVMHVDQADLETVVPKVGKEVMIVNGKGRGRIAEVVSLDKKNYSATLRLAGDISHFIENVDYEDFSKLA